MEEQRPLAPPPVGQGLAGRKSCPCKLQAVGGGERSPAAGVTMCASGKTGGDRALESSGCIVVPTRIAGCMGCCASAMEERDGIGVARGCGQALDSLPRGEGCRARRRRPRLSTNAAGRYRPGWRSRRSSRPPGSESYVLHLEGAGREQHRLAARGRNGIEVGPTIGLPGNIRSLGAGPQKLVARRHTAQDAARSGRGAENLAANAGIHRRRCGWTTGRQHDGPRAALASRRWMAHGGKRCGVPSGRPFGLAVVVPCQGPDSEGSWPSCRRRR